MLSSNSCPTGIEDWFLIRLGLLIKHLQQNPIYNSIDPNCPLPSGWVGSYYLAKTSILPGEGAARPRDSRLACSSLILLWGWELQRVLTLPVHGKPAAAGLLLYPWPLHCSLSGAKMPQQVLNGGCETARPAWERQCRGDRS